MKFRALLLRHAGSTIVASAGQVAVIQAARSGGLVKADRVVELADWIPGLADRERTRQPLDLVVMTSFEPVAFRTTAHVDLVDVAVRFSVPRVLRPFCAPWISGFAAFDDDDTHPPSLWIDLVALGTSLSGDIPPGLMAPAASSLPHKGEHP